MVIFESAVGCRSTRSSVPFIPESEYLIPSTGKDSLPSAAEGSRLVIYLVEGGSKANSHQELAIEIRKVSFFAVVGK